VTGELPQAGPVCLICPTALGQDGVIGGGERFVEELARALARRVRVKLVAFGKELGDGASSARSHPAPGFERVILRNRLRDPASPFSLALFRELAGARVIHACQYFTLPTFLAALYGRVRGVPVFVTDLGGGGWTPAYHLDQSRWIEAHLPLSRYAAQGLPGANRRHRVIYGGVDLDRYPDRPAPEHDGSAVFLGRLLPHKGVHHLIAGAPPEVPVQVLGVPGTSNYLETLRGLASGKNVTFHLAQDDEEVTGRLRRAMALVHPTPVDADGSPGANELFGLALVEAMACGCPVVASNVGPLPEIVEDGVSGLLVPPSDPEAIGRALRRLRAEPDLWCRLSRGARRRVEERFTWDRVAERCLESYRGAVAP